MESIGHAEMLMRPREMGCAVPLTRGQKWFWQNFGPIGGMRVMQPSVRIVGRLNKSALQRSVDALVSRHESLRTRIVASNDSLEQEIDSHFDIDLKEVNLDGSSASTTAADSAHRLTEQFRLERIDLSVGPLFSARLLTLREDEHQLLLGIDHIVIDAVSCGVLSRELWSLYDLASRGLPLSMPPIRIQFPDYAIWESLTAEVRRETHEPYWRNQLIGAPPLALPFDNPSPDPIEFSSMISQYPLGMSLSKQLRALAGKEKVPLSTVVLAAVAASISYWCRQDDFVISFALHGRQARPLLSNMIGLLAKGTYLRVRIKQSDRLIDLVRHINLELTTAIQHRDFVPDLEGTMPFNWVPRALLQPSVKRRGKDGTIEIQPLTLAPRSIPGPQKFLIGAAPDAGDANEEITIVVIHGAPSFRPETIEKLIRNLRMCASELAMHPFTQVSSLNLEQ